MNIVALAGGVGGAKLAHGLAQILPPESLTIIVNTGDDFEHLGLRISPDLDTVMYTLAGLANPETGWGLAGESWQMLEALKRLGGPAWFRLGDKDLATHLERTRRLWAGETLTQVTQSFCEALEVHHRVLPMTDDDVRTMVLTDQGELEFQEYFVHRQCQPRVQSFRFAGIETALPSQAVLSALAQADAVIFCPSNPFVSLDPILHLNGVRNLIQRKGAVAVSPIVGGQAIKGPAAKMLSELQLEVTALSVAKHYAEVLRGFVVDNVDAHLSFSHALPILITDTIMRNDADRARLAKATLDFAWPLMPVH
jgi:LPPG:FO 2-phospho-L-lactate transferase